MNTGLRLTAIDPTEMHPNFTESERGADKQQGRDYLFTRYISRKKVDVLVPILKAVGIDMHDLILSEEISWHDCITAADAIEQNLPQLGSNENHRKWWRRIAKEWRFSGGLRLSKV